MTLQGPGRVQRGLRIFSWILPVFLGLAFGPRAAGAAVHALAQAQQGLTLDFQLEGLRIDTLQAGGRSWSRVRFEGATSSARPGEPDLPALGYLLGVPRSGEARLSVLRTEVQEFPALPPAPAPRARLVDPDGRDLPVQQLDYQPDPRAYQAAGTARPLAALGTLSSLRYQRVQSLGICPVRYDAARGVLLVTTSITVRVEFSAQAQPRAGAGAIPVELLESPGEESLYQQALLNYEQARAFRLDGRQSSVSGHLAEPFAQPAGGLGLASTGFPEFKLRVDTTGLWAVSFDQLQRRCPGLDSLPADELRLYEKLPRRGWLAPQLDSEVPMRVVDVNQDGWFGRGDYLTFFGRNLADRFRARHFSVDSTSLYYTEGEVYWLGRRKPGQSPLRMDQRTSGLGLSNPFTPTSYRATVNMQEHQVFMTNPAYMDQNVVMWLGQVFDDTVAFQVFDPDSARPLGIRAGFRGAKTLAGGDPQGIHLMTVLLQRPQGRGISVDTVVNRYQFQDKFAAVMDSRRDGNPALTGANLSSKRNVFRVIGEHPADFGGPPVPGSGAYVEWFSVHYYRRFRSPGSVGSFRFTSGDTLGNLKIQLDNFQDASVEVYDVSDSTRPVFVDVAATTVPRAGGFAVSFEDTVSVPHAYVASGRAQLPRLPDAAVAVDTPSALAAITDVDMLIVTHESLKAQAQALKAQREAQGLRVALAQVGDVYDEFDGGRKSDVAIKRLVKRLFYQGFSPSAPARLRYLLLLGESSENPMGFKLRLADETPHVMSHTDLVPSPRAFGSVPLGFEYEVLPEDHWYAVGLDSTDRYPMFASLAVGRISASTQAEAGAVVDKIVKYERGDASESWRTRNLYVSDDTWSNGIAFGTNTLVQSPNEAAFQDISQRLRRIVRDAGFSYLAADTFYLGIYTDTARVCDQSATHEVRSFQCMADYGQDRLGPILWNQLSQGHLLVNYQGHANSRLWAHEDIFENSGFKQNCENSVGNTDRPFLLSAFACHVNKYDTFREFDGRLGSGSAERMLFLPRRGAIGSFASTGYEWLPSSSEPDLNYELWRAWYAKPPVQVVGGDTVATLVLGDVLRNAKNQFLLRTIGSAATAIDSARIIWVGYGAKPPFVGTNSNYYEVFSYCLLGDPALRVSPGRASIGLALDGRAANVQGYLLASGADSVTLSADFAGPSSFDSLWVVERTPAGSERSVPAADYQVSGTHAVRPSLGRSARITYRTRPAFEDYTVEFRARDRAGLVSSGALHRVLTLSGITSDKGVLEETRILPSEQTLSITLDTSVPEDSSHFAFFVNGARFAPTSMEQTVDDAVSGGLRHWRMSFHHSFLPGPNEVIFSASGPDGRQKLERSARFRVAAGTEFTLSEVINYPNPFESTTGFHFALTQPADAIRITVLTLAGRRVKELSDPNLDAGTHFLPWDGRDTEGDEIANGVYLYKIVASSAGRSLERLGRLVKVQ